MPIFKAAVQRGATPVDTMPSASALERDYRQAFERRPSAGRILRPRPPSFVLDRRARGLSTILALGPVVEDEDGQGSRALWRPFLTGRECPWRCAMCDLALRPSPRLPGPFQRR